MRIKIKYGDKSVKFESDSKVIKFAKINEPERTISTSKLHLIINSSLNRILKRTKLYKPKTASIVVPDKTRPIVNQKILSLIINFLKENGTREIFLIIAYGNHKSHPVKLLKLKKYILKNVSVIHHNSELKNELAMVHGGDLRSRETFRNFLRKETRQYKSSSLSYIEPSHLKKLSKEFLKRTAKGIFINKTFVNSDLKIVLSDIKPHQIFGYSGGSKMILPGLSDSNTIIANHIMRFHPNSKLGNIHGNLPRGESIEIASKIKNLIYINVITYYGKKIAALSVSREPKDYEKIIVSAKKLFERRLGKFKTVISVGLNPINLNLYQLTKAVTPAAISLRKGGKIIIIADVKEGTENLEAINERIYKLTIKRDLPGSREKIYLLSNLNPRIVRKTFMIPIDKRKFFEMAKNEKESLLIIPDGDLFVPVV